MDARIQNMPDPLDYQPPAPKEPWSLRAILGFVVSVLGPVAGVGFISAHRLYSNPYHLIFILPLSAGLILCIAGLFETLRRTSRKRGSDYAIAGVIACIIWTLSLCEAGWF